MASSYVVNLVVGSGDRSAAQTSTAGHFVVPLAQTLHFEGLWRMCLLNANYPKPQNSKNNSIFILINGVIWTVVGSSLAPLLARLPPPGEGTNESPSTFWELRTTQVPWIYLDQRALSSIDVTIQESDGTLVPSKTPDGLTELYSTVQIVFERIAPPYKNG